MSNKERTKMDTTQMIYEQVKLLRDDLRDHIKDEKDERKELTVKIDGLITGRLLTKQRDGYISAGISAVVAGVMWVFMLWRQ